MNNKKRAIISISIIIFTTLLMILATCIEDLNKVTRTIIGVIYIVIFTVTVVINITYILKNKR